MKCYFFTSLLICGFMKYITKPPIILLQKAFLTSYSTKVAHMSIKINLPSVIFLQCLDFHFPILNLQHFLSALDLLLILFTCLPTSLLSHFILFHFFFFFCPLLEFLVSSSSKDPFTSVSLRTFFLPVTLSFKRQQLTEFLPSPFWLQVASRSRNCCQL